MCRLVIFVSYRVDKALIGCISGRIKDGNQPTWSWLLYIYERMAVIKKACVFGGCYLSWSRCDNNLPRIFRAQNEARACFSPHLSRHLNGIAFPPLENQILGRPSVCKRCKWIIVGTCNWKCQMATYKRSWVANTFDDPADTVSDSSGRITSARSCRQCNNDFSTVLIRSL